MDFVDACKKGNIDKVKLLLSKYKLTYVCLFTRIKIVFYIFIKIIWCYYFSCIVDKLFGFASRCKYINKYINIKRGCKLHVMILGFIMFYCYTDILKLLRTNQSIYTISLKLAYRNGHNNIANLLEKYIFYRIKLNEYKPSYDMLISILIGRKYKCIIPNEIILLIKYYGEMICGKYNIM